MSKFKTTHVAADGTPLYGEPINGVMRYWTKHAYDNFGDAYTGEVVSSVDGMYATVEAEFARHMHAANKVAYSNPYSIAINAPAAVSNGVVTPNPYPAPAHSVSATGYAVASQMVRLSQSSPFRGGDTALLLLSPYDAYCDDVCEDLEERLQLIGITNVEPYVADCSLSNMPQPVVIAIALYDKRAASDAALERSVRAVVAQAKVGAFFFLNDDGSFV